MKEPKKLSDKLQTQSKSFKIGVIAAGVISAMVALPLIRQGAIDLGAKRDLEKRNNDKNAMRYMESCMTLAGEGNFEVARKTLKKLNPNNLNSDLKAKWFTTMTKVYQMEAEVYPKNKQFLIMQALTYAQRGILAGAKQVVKDNLNQMKAQLFMMNEQWEPAAEIYQELQSRTKSPRNRWKYRLLIAKSYKKLKRYDDSIKLLDSVIDETDEENTWANALRRKADIVYTVSQIKHDISELPFNPSETVLTQTVNSAVKNMNTLLEAEGYYRELMENIPSNVHPEKMKAMEKLLEIYVNRGQTVDAYKYANLLKRAAGDRPYTAPVFMQMAKLELRRDNLKRAESYLLRLIKSHPENKLTEPALLNYYQLLKRNKEWARAFHVGYTITQANISVSSKIEIIKDLTMGEALIANNDLSTKDVQAKVNQMFDSIITNNHEMHSILAFAKASNQFKLEDYYKSDIHFTEYLQTPGFSQFKEQAHYYYMLSAVKAGLPPVVQALRAKLYLNNTYNAKRSQEVMLYLMSAYYEMDLWDKSIDAAMKVFVNEIVRMGEEKDKYKASAKWLKAVARIGQSYERLGQDTKAQSVFTTWAGEFKKSPYAASIYADWAQIAADKGQHREALRRLNIIAPFVEDPTDFLLIISMSCIQKLKVNDKSAWKDAEALVKQLPKKKKKLGEKKVDFLLKEIHTAMIENAIEHTPEKAENSFNLALNKYKNDPWPYNLVINWLQKNIDSPNFNKINSFLQKSVSGPLSALNEGELRRAIEEQAALLSALEQENVF
ncbi:MAG: hypothetical protein NE330_04280 [Lentisphaeraceae bacterium]|nr:hypothetical protein [Lentisphaeraceae bacterium]